MATNVVCVRSDASIASAHDGREQTVSYPVNGLAKTIERQLRQLLSEQLSTLEHNFLMACGDILGPVSDLEARSREHKGMVESGSTMTTSSVASSMFASKSITSQDTVTQLTAFDSVQTAPSPKRVIVSRAFTMPAEEMHDVEDDTKCIDMDSDSRTSFEVKKRSCKSVTTKAHYDTIRYDEDSDEDSVEKRVSLASGARKHSVWKNNLGGSQSFKIGVVRPPQKVLQAFAPDGIPRQIHGLEDADHEKEVDKRQIVSARFKSRLSGATLSKSMMANRKSKMTTVLPMEKQTSIDDSHELNGKSTVQFGGRGSEMHSTLSEEHIDFTLLKVWEGEDKPQLKSGKTLSAHHKHGLGGSQLHILTGRLTHILSHPKSVSDPSIYGEDGPMTLSKACNTGFVLNPNSTLRVMWDLMSTLFILYEVVATPLQFFDLEEGGFTLGWAWIARLFWTCDIPMTLCTGIGKPNGDIDMRRLSIAKKYIKTWLIVDICVVGSDWAEYIMSAGSQGTGGAARLTKAFRVMRIVRMVRLLRVGRLPEILERLGEKLPQELTNFIRAAGSVFKSLGFILMLAHTIACIWYGVGDKDSEAWVPHFRLRETPIEYQYMTALHWSVTQFTGSMEINPRNTGERLFAVITLLFAFMVATIFVSSLTSSMTQYYIVSSRTTKMVLELRRYLAKNKVSACLAARLQRNAHFAIKEMQQNVQEDEVEVLRYVSEPLRMELHVEIFYPILEAHPFFARCYQEIPSSTRKMCHTSVSLTQFSEGDTLFVCGEDPDPPEMLFVRAGELQYLPGADPHYLEQDLSNDILPGRWLCEAVLWVHWSYVGDLIAKTDGQLLQLHAKRLQDILSSCNDVLKPRKYAQAFKEQASTTPIQRLTDLGSLDQARSVLRTAYGTSRVEHHHSLSLANTHLGGVSGSMSKMFNH